MKARSDIARADRPGPIGRAAGRLLAGAALALAASLGGTALGCDLPARLDGRVVSLTPGGELGLADGRTVRLAAVSLDSADPDHAGALATALRELALGRDITVAMPAETLDRHGRLGGLVTFAGKDGETLQATLAGLGLALARPEEGFLYCLDDIHAQERLARAAGYGLWERGGLDAADVGAIRGRSGHFAVIEGRIHDIGEGRSLRFLNFGPVWRHDLTVRIPRESDPAFVAAGIDASALAGQRVRVRGVVFEAGGPAIDVRWPAQIERTEGGGGTR
ncbi:thermonuclease family protein [Ancylobacter terrae]|uniref:thermonuclease family protein n=1 Tax=Ancylobacter sp. sgz301288 TaxID=3342077 RepID=UPI00385ACB08